MAWDALLVPRKGPIRGPQGDGAQGVRLSVMSTPCRAPGSFPSPVGVGGGQATKDVSPRTQGFLTQKGLLLPEGSGALRPLS